MSALLKTLLPNAADAGADHETRDWQGFAVMWRAVACMNCSSVGEVSAREQTAFDASVDQECNSITDSRATQVMRGQIGKMADEEVKYDNMHTKREEPRKQAKLPNVCGKPADPFALFCHSRLYMQASKLIMPFHPQR